MLLGVRDGVLVDGELLGSSWRSEELGELLGGWGAGKIARGLCWLFSPLQTTGPGPDTAWLPVSPAYARVSPGYQGNGFGFCQLRASREQWQGFGSPHKS